MNSSPSLAVKLYGTEEAVAPMQTLHAGALSAQFDQGALRFVRINGVEAIRNIAFVVRDKDWGTYNPVISNLEIEQSEQAFRVSFDAVCKDDSQQLDFSATIVGEADGSLQFSAIGTALTDFNTNRTGFVVLHPVAGVSGFPLEVEHVDGSVEQSVFPELVDPVQPFKDIRALTHEVAPGVRLECRMQGDTFEMEDHRQWNDASYKTYVRPIALPWPYIIAAKTVIEQSVTLTLHRSADAGPVQRAAAAHDCLINVSRLGVGSMPLIGLGQEPQHMQAALQHTGLIARLAPGQLLCWHDLGAGHGVAQLQSGAELAAAGGAELVLEVVIPGEDYRQEISTLAAQVEQAACAPAAVCVSPAAYLKSIMPGTDWPDVAPLADIYAAARAAFPEARIGGGMHAFFPELNRHRPPLKAIDYISHTSNTITHACDDITVTENLEAIPYIIKTCRSFAADKPYHVGPSAIGMRFNPYGSRTMDNPGNRRVAMARMEPRQRGLLNAAWTLGYVAHMARGDVDAVALQAAVGEFGLIYHKMPWSQPWFDQAQAEVYPAFHVASGMAAAAGRERLMASSSNSHDVECIACLQGQKTVLWLANLTADRRSVKLIGLPAGEHNIATLDCDTFEQCTAADGFVGEKCSSTPKELELSAYAVVRLECG